MALSSNQKLYIAVFAIIIIMVVGTLMFIPGNYGGSDDAGGEAAEETGYTPWCQDLFASFGFELPGETESMLFAVQAAIGAFIIGYFVGTTSAKKKSDGSSAETQ